MNVRWTVNDLNTVLTASWNTVAGAQGYSFWKDGLRVSYTMDGTRTSTRFGLDGATHSFEVRALGRLDSGSTPYPLPSAPPPVSVSGPYSALTQAQADALAGKNLQLKAGEGIACGSRDPLERVTLRCTVEMKGDRSVIAPSVILKRDTRHTLAGMVAVEGNYVRMACEVDCSGMKCNGVELGTLVANIKAPDTSGLYVHDVVESSFVSPQYHGIYVASCDGWVGDNMRFERITGYGIHLNGNSLGGPVNAKVSRVTLDHCWGGIVYWNYSAGNEFSKVLITNMKGAPAVSGKSMAANPKPDYVTIPTPGYGSL